MYIIYMYVLTDKCSAILFTRFAAFEVTVKTKPEKEIENTIINYKLEFTNMHVYHASVNIRGRPNGGLKD